MVQKAQLGPKMSKMVHNGEEKCHFYASTESLMTETQDLQKKQLLSLALKNNGKQMLAVSGKHWRC